jgi:DNA-binding winged helix-turn-helix (wHTH) protein
MKILIISNDLLSALRVKNFLKEENLDCDFKIFSDERELLIAVPLLAKNYRAFVFDRIKYDLLKIYDLARESCCFFIVNDFNKVVMRENVCENDLVLKFYFSPVNYRLLSDDIKSLALVKDYLIDELVTLDNVALNLNTRVITDGEREIFLRNKEFELLLYLARNRGRLLSRVNILENVWDMNSNLMTNTVDVHISRLRKILKEYFGISSMIRTVPCSGYILS